MFNINKLTIVDINCNDYYDMLSYLGLYITASRNQHQIFTICYTLIFLNRNLNLRTHVFFFFCGNINHDNIYYYKLQTHKIVI